MRPTAGDPRGGVRGRGATLGLATMLPGLMLVIVIFWALAAVLMLTGTLINAREIEDTVEVINGEVSSTDGIDKDLDSVKELEQTRRTVASIRDAADPLTGQADQIIAAAGSINRSARSILSTAGSINTTAKSINSTVLSINASVNSIGASVVQINQRVNSIGASVTSINSLARSIDAAVGPEGATDSTSINASVTRILRELRGTNAEVVTIDRGAAAINRRADRAINLARGIKSDFAGTRAGVDKIDAHANSIDCAALLNIVGQTTGCNQ
jgi:methyl-accepting chemotaxis protein